MLTAIALQTCDLPVPVARRHGLAPVERAPGRPEYRFVWAGPRPVLPVRVRGRVAVLPWGSVRRTDGLPHGSWLGVDRTWPGAEEVVVPATFAQAAGVWFLVNEGMKGAAIVGPAGPVVYLLGEPASYYYRNMAGQSKVMPVLLHQTI